jgi:hypothetical protein
MPAVLVTGANRGLGLEFVRQIARVGLAETGGFYDFRGHRPPW